MDTPQSLLRELRDNPSDQVWQRLVHAYDSLFRVWLRSQGVSEEDCDDLVQEILLVMMRKLPEFKHAGTPGAFRAWAKRVAVNCARNFWKAKGRVPVAQGGSGFLEHLNQLGDSTSELSREWDRQHERVVVQRLLDHIREDAAPQMWEAFSQHVVNGRSAGEVADTLGVTTGYVYLAKSRILSRLREYADGIIEDFE